jgi:pilus assembly protein TadC
VPSADVVAVRRPLVVAAAVAIVALLVVGAPWWLVAVLAACAIVGGRRRTVESVSADEVPVTADLMAACMSAGAGVGTALSASLVVAGPWLSSRGEPVVAALQSGALPEEAWQTWLSDARLAPIARTCVRTAGSGAAAAAELTRVAARLRAHQRMTRQQRVAKASIWIVLPLGTCFLPAFVAVGVVPLVVSLLAGLR